MKANVRPTEMFTKSQRLPTGYVSVVEEAIKNFGTFDSVETGSSTCTGDSDPHWLIVDRNKIADEFHECDISFTEIFTDKTSAACSDWDVACEYDLLEADRVRLMFASMFSLLFESLSADASPAHLAKECKEWVTCFPHLRLLGEQILAPQEKGYDFYPTSDIHKNSSDSGLESESDSSEGITLLGRKLEPNTPPSTARSGASTNSQTSSLGAKDDLIMEEVDEYHSGLDGDPNDGEEEIIVSEGIYEDVIAMDYRPGDDDASEHLKRYVRQRRRGLPPMTPSAAIRDTVCNTIFDILWADTVAATRQLVFRLLHGPTKSELELELESHLPRISPADMTALASAQRDGAVPFPKLPQAMGAGAGDSKTLTGLLHITTKTLQFRERSYLQDIPESPPVDRRAAPEGSRPPPAATTRVPGTDSRVPSAARRARGRLAPLDRSRTAMVEEEGGFGLRGHRLQKPGAPADGLTRSGTLPPLSMSLLMKPGAAQQRINSAAVGRPGPAGSQGQARPVHQSVSAAPSGELRPSTTHTFHPSPLSGLKPLGSLLSLGIHGSSIGTAPGTAAGAPGQPEDECDEKRTRVPWGPVYPASLYPVHQILRRGKSNVGMHNSTVR